MKIKTVRVLFLPAALLCVSAAGCGGGGEREDADLQQDEESAEDAPGDGDAPDAPDEGADILDGRDQGEPTDGTDAADVEELDGTPPPVPDLRPVTSEQAASLGAYARLLHVFYGGVLGPMAWSMANQSCQERALALEYALAAAEDPLGTQPPSMDETELTDERIGQLAASPASDSASINITGPLVAEQTFVMPDGSPVAGTPQRLTWPYHHGVVVNVEGELRVMDLSVGDEPMPIDEWAHSFVDGATPCYLMEETEYQEVWSYWLTVHSSWMPESRPSRVCGYTITPIFTWRWDQDPLAGAIRFTPSTMLTQTEAFKTILQTDYALALPDEQLPFVTSRYAPKTEADLCAWTDYPYCDTL